MCKNSYTAGLKKTTFANFIYGNFFQKLSLSHRVVLAAALRLKVWHHILESKFCIRQRKMLFSERPEGGAPLTSYLVLRLSSLNIQNHFFPVSHSSPSFLLYCRFSNVLFRSSRKRHFTGRKLRVTSFLRRVLIFR